MSALSSILAVPRGDNDSKRCQSTDPSLYPWCVERRCELAHGHAGYHTRHAGDGKALVTWSVGGLPMAPR